MEDVVDRRETDILVAAPVAGDVVRVEQLIVVSRLRAPGADGAGGTVGKVVTSSSSHSLRKARSPDSIARVFTCSTVWLCSEWKMWWTAERPIFSLPRPSPVM